MLYNVLRVSTFGINFLYLNWRNVIIIITRLTQPRFIFLLVNFPLIPGCRHGNISKMCLRKGKWYILLFSLQGVDIVKCTTPVGVPNGKAYFEAIIPEGSEPPTSANLQWYYGAYGPHYFTEWVLIKQSEIIQGSQTESIWLCPKLKDN